MTIVIVVEPLDHLAKGEELVEPLNKQTKKLRSTTRQKNEEPHSRVGEGALKWVSLEGSAHHGVCNLSTMNRHSLLSISNRAIGD